MPSSPARTVLFVSYTPADEGWASWIAWELESAGYRVVLQAWDFVPGTNFVDFMDRGVASAGAVIAVLSRAYLTSRFGRWEWQTAILADPGDPAAKLITVRVEDCPIEGLLSTITYVDLVGVARPGGGPRPAAHAGQPHPRRAGQAGHAPVVPEFRRAASVCRRPPSAIPARPAPAPGAGSAGTRAAARRRGPSSRPPRRPGAPAPPRGLTVLHVPGPRFAAGRAPRPPACRPASGPTSTAWPTRAHRARTCSWSAAT